MTAKIDRWYHFETCRGKRQDGRPCNSQPVRPYEERLGNLVIPQCCWQHRDQEAALAADDHHGIGPPPWTIGGRPMARFTEEEP